MKKLLFAFFLLSASMFAQTTCVNCGGSTTFASGGTTNNVIPKSNGSSALADSSITDNGTNVSTALPLNLTQAQSSTNAIVQFNGVATTGLMFGAATQVGLKVSAANWLATDSNQTMGLQVPSLSSIGWSSSTTYGGAVSDTGFRRRGVANISIGIAADVNGVPVAQTLSVQNAITGTNLTGAQFTLAGGLGTGTALPLPVVIQGADASVASGGTAQTEINRLVVGDTKNLTTGAATTVLSVPLATLQMMGGTIDYYMEATDGTNQCTSKGTVDYSGENSAGVFVVGVTAIGNLTSSCTATKTLTATWAVTSANPSLIQITPTLTGITATRFTLVYEVHHMGNTNPTL